jgi:peptide deformylase
VVDMPIREILLLGNPQLYEKSLPVSENEFDTIKSVTVDLHDSLMDFRSRYSYGRAIAAPQIGVMKRILYLCIDEPVIFINPVLDMKSKEMFEVWDDCMSFPDLLVKVLRHRSCRIKFFDRNWEEKEMRLEGALSELMQHEYDHLDGILAVSRALDGRSFALRKR